MREGLLELLQCPHCHHFPLIVNSTSSDEREIRQGELVCQACQHVFPICGGVVELLSGLDANTLRERNARVKERSWEIERQRPYYDDNPEHPWIWPAFAANVQQGIRLASATGKKVLDIGAATCWSTRMFCEQGATATGLDISTSMLLDAEAQFSPDIFFNRVAANMAVLPFRDETFDVIFFSAAAHHAENLTKVFLEASRCLKPGGKAVLVNEPVLGRLRNGRDFGMADCQQGMNEHIYSLRQYQAAAQGAGLQAKIFFPESLRQQLEGEIPIPPTVGLRITKLLWPNLLNKLKNLLVFPGMDLAGIDLILVLEK